MLPLFPRLILSLTLSSTVGEGSLFSDDAPLDFSESELPETETFHPIVRAAMRFDLKTALDAAFDDRPEHVFELILGGRLQLDVDIAKDLSAFVAPSIEYVTAFQKDGTDREFVYLDVPEAFVLAGFDRFHLRVGTIIFNWGSSDIIGPNDQLNPFDLRRGILTNPDESKRPVFAAEGVLGVEPFTFRAVVEPFFTPSRFFMVGWDQSIGVIAAARGLAIPDVQAFLSSPTLDRALDEIIIRDRPTDRLDNATVGGRITFSTSNFDASVTGVYGWEALPEIRLNPDLVFLADVVAESLGNRTPIDLTDPELLMAVDRIRQATEEGRDLFESTYRRKGSIGFDAVLAVEPVLLKLDVAYSPRRTLYTQTFQPVPQAFLNTVIGIEYFEGGDFQMILEAFAFTAFDVRSFYRLMFIEPVAPPPSALDLGGRTVSFPGLAGVVRYALFDGEIQLEIAGVGTLTRGDLMLSPSLRWNVTDHHHFKLGGVIIEGPADGYGGIYGHNDQIYTQYQWTY